MVAVANAVQGAVTGSVYVAPASTAVPTTIAGALNAAFNDVGYISEDGVVTSTNSDTNEIKAWQNGDIVRVIQTSHEFTLKFTMIETNEYALKAYYNSYTHGAGAADGVVQVTGTAAFRGAWVINVVDGTDLIRIVVPDGQVTDRDDVSYVNGDPISYGVTVTCYPDSSNVKAYIYFAADYAS